MAGSRLALLAALLALAVSARAQEHVDGGSLGAAICASADADNWHFPHPTECNRFIKCDVANGFSSIVTCPGNLLYNAAASVCDYPDSVDCSAGAVTTTTTRKPATTTTTRKPATTTTTKATTTTTTTTRKPATTTTVAPSNDFNGLCRRYNPHRYHVPHPSDSTKFYKCDWDREVATEFDCPAGLVFNAPIQVCDWP